MLKNIFLVGGFFRNRKKIFLLGLVLYFFGALLEGISYTCLLLAFTTLFGALPEQFQFLAAFFGDLSFYFAIGGAILSQLVKSTFCFMGSSLLYSMGLEVQREVQVKIFDSFFSMDFAKLQRHKTGELLEYTRAPLHFFRPFLEHFSQLIASFLLIAVSLFCMFFLSIKLTLWTLTLLGLCAFFQKITLKKTQVLGQKLTIQFERISHVLVQILNGMKTIHLFNAQKKAKEKLAGEQTSFIVVSKKLILAQLTLSSLSEVVGVILVGTSLMVGWAIFRHEGPLLLGFMTIAYRLVGKLLGFFGAMGQLATLSGYLHQMRVILNEKIEAKSQQAPAIFEKEITFSHVTLSYPGSSLVAIDDLSLTIKKGEMVAIVGHSGSGKSSLIDLLLGFQNPSRGEIAIDGNALSLIDLTSWRSLCGVVNQDFYLFNETIEENLLWGGEGDVHEALVGASAHAFVMKLQQGIKTEVGERGYGLSGGESQRIALARAMMRDPEILILDEATSHLDGETENAIHDALKRLKGKKTIIVIAHSLAHVLHADKIIVMDEGRKVEEGIHDELLKKRGHYFQRVQGVHV